MKRFLVVETWDFMCRQMSVCEPEPNSYGGQEKLMYLGIENILSASKAAVWMWTVKFAC